MDRLANPVDTSIPSDSLVLGVNKNDFKVLIRRILVDPVRVEDAQVGAATAHALLGGGLESTLVLELVDTHVGGFSWRNQSIRLKL